MDLKKLSAALHAFNALDPKQVMVHHMSVLLFIAEGGEAGVRYKAIEEEMGMENASVSRTVNSLSEFARHREGSYALVRKFRDPGEGRRYRVAVTDKGRALIKSLEAI